MGKRYWAVQFYCTGAMCFICGWGAAGAPFTLIITLPALIYTIWTDVNRAERGGP